MIWLGLDIGTNSVGSAWVDTEAQTIVLGVSVFPAGVEEREDKRGDPKNKARRLARSQRRSIARRAKRKRQLRKLLIGAKLLPADPQQLCAIFSPTKKEEKEEPERWDPWRLRREGLERELSPYEFGRVLVHLNQRRGAFGVEVDSEDPEEGKVKKAIEHTDSQLAGRTFGEFIADLIEERRKPLPGLEGHFYREAVRNRRGAFEFHATRAMIREEFNKLWERQKSFNGELAQLLTDALKRKLDDPEGDAKHQRAWRHQGILFGQRRTYWRTGTLGRCDLEPTDRCCPLADRHAQEFRVLETINNLRIEERGKEPRPLDDEERAKIIRVLRCQKSATPATLRKALGIDKKDRKAFFTLNVERDPEREINPDWFYREVVHGALTEEVWLKMTEQQRESVNRAVLKFDAKIDEDIVKLRQGAMTWWGLSPESADQFIEACKTRPALDKRVKLSRRAIQNLLPYLRRGLSVTEARKHFAEDTDSPATPEQRRRYSLKASVLTRAEKHFLEKHPNQLPPAPELSNPVVRKAIHEVRRHLNAYLQRFGRKPDRVVVEMAREARLPGRKANEILALNRKRETIRKEIIKEFNLENLTPNQRARAVERVLLCRQQRNVCAYSDGISTDDKKSGRCPYSGRTITEQMAVEGTGLQVDHIIPLSRSQDNSLSNKVLCFVDSNQDKGNQTPKEWLGDGSEAFRRLEQRMSHFEKAEEVYEYFTKKDYARKWENLHRDAPDFEHFLNSQLTDTAYAARQVAQWLRDVLFNGEMDGTRRVFAGKGIYTALLRRHWGLGEDALDQQWHGDSTKTQEQGQARRDKKDRSDHRHHAIDALVIAFCGPERLQALADLAGKQEQAKARQGRWTKGDSLPPPWGTREQFRAQVIEVLARLVVCHRPVKRRLVGRLHQATPYGKARGYPGLFTFRMSAQDLQPSNLRPPRKNVAKNGTVTWSIQGRGQGSVVHDPALREAIRACLTRHGIDPDNFGDRDMKKMTDRTDYKLRLSSGVPIYSLTMMRTLNEPIRIVGRDGVERFYVGGNNHHFEIVEDLKTGRWSGIPVDMFEAARRVRPPRREPKRDLIQRDHGPGKRFIMSLAEGETVWMKHPKTGNPGYFVVFKLTKARLFFIHHWDARPSATRESISLSTSQLRELGPEPNKPPCKVRVGPLGTENPRKPCSND